jgi:hypothetical protein
VPEEVASSALNFMVLVKIVLACIIACCVFNILTRTDPPGSERGLELKAMWKRRH